MNREEIIPFLNRNPVCHLATVEGGKPRVRGMFMYRADEQGLLFHTGAGKALALTTVGSPMRRVLELKLSEVGGAPAQAKAGS